MIYWLTSEDIQAQELEMALHSELNKAKSFIYLTATQNIKRMRCSSALLSPIFSSMLEQPNIFTAIDFVQVVSRPIHKEGGILTNSDQRYILAKLIQKQYVKDSAKQKAIYAMRHELFDLFQVLLFNNVPITDEAIKSIKKDYSEVESSIFKLYHRFSAILSGLTETSATEEQIKAARRIVGSTKKKATATFAERQKQVISKALADVKAVVFDGFLFLNELQKYILTEAVRQKKTLYLVTKRFKDKTGTFIFEEGMHAHIPSDVRIKKIEFVSKQYRQNTALNEIKSVFPDVANAHLNTYKLSDQTIRFISPFVGREEELNYVVQSISNRLRTAYQGDINELIRMVNEEIAIIVAIDKEKYEDRISKLFRDTGLFLFDRELLADTQFNDIDHSTVSSVFFTKNEYLESSIQWQGGKDLTYQEKLRLFELGFQRIDINKYQRPIASYPVGQFVLEVYRLIAEGISIEGFKSILYSNWRYVASGRSTEKWSDNLNSFRYIEPYLEDKSTLSDWIEVVNNLLELKETIESNSLYVYHPLKAIASSSLLSIADLLRHLSDMVGKIANVSGDIGKHLNVLRSIVMNTGSIHNREDERLEFEEIVLKRLSLAVKDIGGHSLIPQIEANYFAQNIRVMLNEWEKENATDTDNVLRLNVVNLENMKQYRHSYFVMCEASKYPRRYMERFPYTPELLKILKSDQYGMNFVPQDLKGDDYHLQLERYLFKNTLDFTTDSITFTYSEKENDSANRPSIFIEDIVTAFDSEIPYLTDTQLDSDIQPWDEIVHQSFMDKKSRYSLTELATFKLCPRLYFHTEIDENKGVYLNKHQLRFYFEAILFCDLFERFMQYNLDNKMVYCKGFNGHHDILHALWPNCIEFHKPFFEFFSEYEKQDVYRNVLHKVCSSLESSIQYITGEHYTILSYNSKDYKGAGYILTIEHDNRFVDYDKKTWRMSQNSTYLHFLVLKTTDSKTELKHYADMIQALNENDTNEDRINLMSRIIAKINIQFDSGRFVQDGIARTDDLVNEVCTYNFAKGTVMPSNYCTYCRYSETCVGT